MFARVVCATGVAVVLAAGPAAAEVVKVAHGPIAANLIPVADKPSAGDLRTYYIGLTKPGKKKRIGFLTGSLLTTAVDAPSAGKELRSADLVFTIGKPANQIVLGGVAAYDQTAPTLSKKSTTVRPVLGGSGKYAGARGWCESIHFKNNSWRHTFHLKG